MKISTAKATLHRLIDSDVTVNFIFSTFIKNKNLTSVKLHASVVRGVNRKILTEASSAEYYLLSIKVDTMTDTLLFCILNLLKYNIILRLS